jgi:hypothetical protein
MVKNKKRIRKSIERIDKRKEEHEEKIKHFSQKKPWLGEYWKKEIENFEKEKKNLKEKLKKK